MGDQQVGKETAETKLLGILPPPSKVSHWCEVQHEVIKVDIEWIIPQFSLLDAFKNWDCVSSTLFSHQESFHHWKLNLSDMGPNLGIQLRDPLINSDDSKCHDPTRVTIAISNKRREKIFPQQHCLPKNTNLPYTVFQIEKKFLIESECLVNDKLTIYCEIEEYFYNPPLDGEDYRPGEIPFGNRSQLLYNLQDLFKNMKYSDIIVNVRGREFKAHKNILAARSSYFAAMFDHPTKENLSNQIEIDDIEPGVFHEILRYIYTGQVSEMAMEKKVVGILAVADKYLLDPLKEQCESQLTNRLSMESCLQLLLLTDKHHPAFYLRESAVYFFRDYSVEVMATDSWKMAKKEHPEQCFGILEDSMLELVKTGSL